MPREAVIRLTTRLHDQSVLITTEEDWAGCLRVGTVNAGLVEFINEFDTDRLAS